LGTGKGTGEFLNAEGAKVTQRAQKEDKENQKNTRKKKNWNLKVEN
jgi:hypothetical protein